MNVPKLLLLAGLITLPVRGPASAAADDDDETDRQSILRFDPLAGQLVPVPLQDRKIGYIYRHFSPRLDRWVWGFYQGDDRFSFALGKGSLQPAHRLDLPPAAENAAEVGRGVATTLAEAVSDPRNRGIYARLNDRDEWELYGPFGVPSVYDAESGLRWENHGRRYVPVSHTRGYRWTADGEGYSPAASFLPAGCFSDTAAGY